jgi:hypothetical protein
MLYAVEAAVPNVRSVTREWTGGDCPGLVPPKTTGQCELEVRVTSTTAALVARTALGLACIVAI